MLARPRPTLAPSPQKMYLDYMCLYTVQQFIMFTVNVEKGGLFCLKLLFISCSIQMLSSNTKLYDILRISG